MNTNMKSNKIRRVASMALALILIFSTNLCSAMPYEVIEKVRIQDGLSHNGITTLMRDSRGYIWAGSYDGISIYNGHFVKQLKNETKSNYVSSNRIHSLAEDCDGNIWIGSESGISKYYPRRERFENLNLSKSYASPKSLRIVKHLLFCDKGRVVYGVVDDSYVAIFNINGELKDELRFGEGVVVNSLALLQDNHLMIATSRGAMLYNSDDASLKVIRNLKSGILHNLCHSLDGNIIITTPSRIFDGALCLDGSNNPYFKASGRSVSINSRIRALRLDSRGSLWIAYFSSGVDYIEQFASTPAGGSMRRISLGKIRGSDFLTQGDDDMWVATFDEGLQRLSYYKSNFVDIAKECGISDVKMSRFAVVGDNKLFITSFTHQLHLYDITKRRATPLPFKLSREEQAAYKSIKGDSRGNLWIFMQNSRWLRIDKSNRIHRIDPALLAKLGGRAPLVTQEDNYGNIWIGAQDMVYKVNLDGHSNVTSIEPLSDNDSYNKIGITKIRTIYADPLHNNTIWIGTISKGVIKVTFDNTNDGALSNATIENFQSEDGDSTSLPSNFISAIIRDRESNLWIGTEMGGLCRMDINTDKDRNEVISFRQYTTKNGLSNNVIKSLACDNAGHLWIGTNYGLNRYDYINKRFYIYNRNDGMPFDEFWYEADKLSSGDLIFNGANGLSSFHPTTISKDKSQAKLHFSTLKILNSDVTPSTSINGRVIINNRLESGDSISLKYDENIITIGVDAIFNKSSSSNMICYQLLPLNEEWINIPASMGAITLNGLASGNYTLRVGATTDSGTMSDIKSLNIYIAPHPWRSPQAMAIYIVIAIIFLCLLFTTMLNIASLLYSKRNLERLNNEKQRYFSNISHELKTPLSLILAPIENLSQRFRFDVDITSKVESIRRQSRRMLQIIDSVQKLTLDELAKLTPEKKIFNFNNFVDEITQDFKFAAEYDKKLLTITNECDSDVWVNADKSMVAIIICNIINNAFKYTKSGDTISINHAISSYNGQLIIEITDSGQGISEDDIPKIFDRFFQGLKSGTRQPGTGIGLSFTKRLVEIHNGSISAKSKLSEGSTFTINLPVVIEKPENADSIESKPIYENANVIESTTLDSIVLDSAEQVKSSIIVGEEFRDSMIFVVEDNAEMRQTIVDTLSPYFRVKSFSGGNECLEQLKSSWPQLIVSDVMMDNGNGYELCKSVKEELSTSHIPIIMLSGCSSVDDMIRGLEVGADDYIYKPFYMSHLITRIDYMLRSRQELRKRFEVGIPLEMGESRAQAKIENQFLERLYSIFNDNLDNENIDVDIIASELGLTRSVFYQKIKALTDNTPYELLKEYRLKRAASLLESGEHNVNEVCLIVGFKNRAHFSKLFKERFDISPSKFAKEKCKNQ